MGKNDYIKKYDKRGRRLYVWPKPKIWVGQSTRKTDKSADLDEIFGRKDEHQEEDTRDTEDTTE